MAKKIDTTENNERYQVEYLETPIKSENDLLKYRVIRLQNGLTALLISENENEEEDDTPDSDANNEEDDNPSAKRVKKNDLVDTYYGTDLLEWIRNYSVFLRRNRNLGNNLTILRIALQDRKTISAYSLQRVECGLDVGVGRFSNAEIPDIAHLVEHMVSRGSEKYEHENDFIEFINEHGGCTNSLTDYEHTTFYFALNGIQKNQLSSALDRFAQFFIKPLMKKDVIKRMIVAVENELQLSSTHDKFKKNQLLISSVPIGHPVNKFPWPHTLMLRNNVNDNKLDKLYDELHKFRERHYSAHRMKLVIQSSLSLNALEKYVTKFFADIPNNGLPPDDFTKFKDNVPFNTPAFRSIYKIRPVKDIKQLHITWAMPSLLHLYKSKPHSYILWIIKHKGKGSLMSYLREKQWSFDFLHDNPEDDFEQNSIYTLFNLILDLSAEGTRHVPEILDAIFSFINLLKREGPQKRIYDEIYNITENTFRLLGNNDYIECLCKNMHLYPPRDYITGKQNYFEYDPEAIQKCLDYLVPETVNIVIFNKNFDVRELTKINMWAKIIYEDIKISQECIERWKSIEPLPDFHLPLSNTFVASDVSLLSTSVVAAKYPIKLTDTRLLQIWHHYKFNWPKCYINFQFIVYPLGFQSPKIKAFMEMYCNVLKQLLRTNLFPVVKAEIEYDITVSEIGIVIEMNGFNEKLLKFLPIIARYMNYSTIVTKHLFELVKMQQLERYYNKFMKPEKLIKNVKLWILKETIDYTYIDTYIALRDINFEDFKKFVKSFTDHLYIQCLVQGNITKNTTIEALQRYTEKINCSPLVSSTILQTRIQIPLGTSYCKLKNMNKTDTNSVITNYYQAGITSTHLSGLIDLIIIIMQEPLKNQLCFQEQLSNKVFCVRRDDNGILGFSITVHIEAHKYTTEHVDQRIEEFLESFSMMLKVFPQEELNIIKETLLTRELEQSTSVGFLKYEVDRNWSEITKQRYMFDGFKKKTLAIMGIKINELREWFTYTLNESNFRKLSLHVIGTDPKEIETREANDTAMDYNKEQDFILEYITDNQQHNETEGRLITNIEHYKRDLSI